jgi:hypothetical protein
MDDDDQTWDDQVNTMDKGMTNLSLNDAASTLELEV